MSQATDIKLAKWLIKNKVAEKTVIEKWLNAKFKAEKAGKKVPSFLNLLVKKEVISADQITEIKEAFQNNKSLKPSDVSEEVNPSKETTEGNEEAAASESSEAIEKEDTPSTQPSQETRACPECSSSLSIDSKECHVCGAEVPTDALIQCVFCGKSQPANNDHCDHCGCSPHTGEEGPLTQKCDSCEVKQLPDTAVCVSCGVEQSIDDNNGSVTSVPNIVFVLVLIIFTGPSAWVSLEFSEKLAELHSSKVSKKKDFYGEDAFQSVSPMDLPDIALDVSDSNPKAKLFIDVLPLVKDKKWEESIDLIESKLEEVDPMTLSILGLSYFHLNKVDELVALEKARPDIEELKKLVYNKRYQESIERMKKGDSASAYATLKPVLLSNVNVARINFWGGLMALQENLVEEADQWLTKSTKLQPKEDLGHLLLYKLHKSEDSKRSKKEKAEFLKNKTKSATFKKLLD